MIRRVLVFAFSVIACRGANLTADSSRGRQLFETLSCVQCHSINGKGGTAGPDLGRIMNRGFTPATLAATMWNHAPNMWAGMRIRDIQAGDLNEQAALDLFAYFYSVRFFEKPGDAARGKQLFASKHCANCHGLKDAKLPRAKPVSQWESIGYPINLVDAMWNHAATMREEFARQHIRYPELTSQDLADILVYLRNLPEQRNEPAAFMITAGATGSALFTSKGCAGCHTGRLDLPPRLKNKTLTDIAVDMWNHQPKMAPTPPPLNQDEMREIVSFLWAEQFFRDEGNASAGGRVFTSKRCAVCHNDASSGAPKLAGLQRSFSAATMVSTLWHHGPRMLDQMRSKEIVWPRFDGAEMANLIAYLNEQNKVK